MENKNNFMGIIIPVIVAVILLTILPIINGINGECPPCEECPSYNIGNLEINPDFSSGNYNVDKGSYDYLDSVTIIKDDNLLPENIKKDVTIFGITGTLESSGGLQGYTLYGSLSGGGNSVMFNLILYADGTYETYKSYSESFEISDVIYFRCDYVDVIYVDGTITETEFTDENGVVMTQDISIYVED